MCRPNPDESANLLSPPSGRTAIDSDTPAAAGRWTRVWARCRTEFSERLAIDTRALAAMRIFLGLVIILDLVYRSFDLAAFYTDRGVLPRHMVTANWPESEFVLHSVMGDTWFQAVLFVLQGLVALALLVGFQTPIATVLSFLLLLSLHVRNPYILNAGDVLLRIVVFWGIFLPLGERWSIDAMMRGVRQPARRVMDAATAALLLQVLIVYSLNAYHKIQGGRWITGEALQYVFLVDRYMTPLGQQLTNFPAMVPWLTKGWLALVTVAPLLLLTTGRVRMLVVAAFASAHLGMYVFMQLGFFPLVSVVALFAFLPRGVWDAAERRVLAPVANSAPVRRIALLLAIPRHNSPDPDDPADDPGPAAPPLKDRLFRSLQASRSVVAITFLLLLVSSTASSAGLVTFPDVVQKEFDSRERQWKMFATPTQSNAWVVAPARLESTTIVDAIHIERGKWDEPHYLDPPHPEFRWRKYLDAVSHPGRTGLLQPFATYLCDDWNRAHDDKMEALTIYRFVQPINLTGPDPAPTRYELIYHECAL